MTPDPMRAPPEPAPREAAAPEAGRPDLTRPELTRLVAADLGEGIAAERRAAAPATMVPMFLRHDGTHELPLVVETDRGRPIARFARLGDLAIFVSRDRKTLPARFVALVETALAPKSAA